MTLDQLPAHERDQAIDGFIADVVCVFHHVLADEAYPCTTTMRALLASLERREFPLVQPTMATVVAWVCFQTRWDERFRPLTPDELAVKAAAWRLSDAIHGPRHH